MGLNFRKSVKMGPVRVNLSKSGVGYSVGGKGVRVTKKAVGGTRTTARIPGTGISYTTESSKKKSSIKSSSKSKNSSNNYVSSNSGGSSSRSENGGCLKGCLWFLTICLFIGLISKYWKILLVLLVIAVAAYIAFKLYRKRNPAAIAEAGDDPGHIPDTAGDSMEQPQLDEACSTTSAVGEQLASAYAQFSSELQSIPQVDIPLSESAPRHLLKEMPPYDYSNITRKTRLDFIFPLVVLDVETTGLYPSKHEIIEVSAIKFDTGMIPISCFTTFCKPKNSIPPEATAINHITDDMVADAPSFNQIAPALSNFIQGHNIVGHNLDFDLRFIFAHGADLPESKRFYDTLDLAHLTVPKGQIDNYKLDTLCSYYGVWREKSHSSLSDCYATSKIFSHLVFDKTDRRLDVVQDDAP